MNSYRNSGGGSAYDRWLEHEANNSTLTKMQHQFWVTKQTVYRKLGKKEDACIVASDSELDAKLELFKSVQDSCMELQQVIERYQDRLFALSQEENTMGRFLKEAGKVDKTRAGKMMAAVGKSLSYSGQQRLTLRVPLMRLYQEVETFRFRAIEDTFITVKGMEKVRTEYRATLNWMKNVSQELDPDTFKQLEKFRKVQTQVRRSKSNFDKLKLDCLQKIDLLAAARCNMFSHALILYQNSMMQYAEKAEKTYDLVAKNFKGYQHYEFSVIKELTEPSLKLAEQMSRDSQGQEDEEDKDKLLFFDSEYHDEDEEESKKESGSEKKRRRSKEKKPKSDSLENLFGNVSLSSDGKEPILVDLEQDMKPGSKQPGVSEIKSSTTSANNGIDLLTDNSIDLNCLERETKEALAFLEELSSPQHTPASPGFGEEWNAVFGSSEDSLQRNQIFGGELLNSLEPSSGDGSDQVTARPSFLPSQLLDLSLNAIDLSEQVSGQPTSAIAPQNVTQAPQSVTQLPSSTLTETTTKSAQPASVPSSSQPAVPVPSKKSQSKDMSAWFNLFADLDPLSNPDAIGQKPEQINHNC